MEEKKVAKAVRLAGGVTAVCKAMNVRSKWSVYKWINANQVPPRRVIELERLTNGQVTRHELSPEIYPK